MEPCWTRGALAGLIVVLITSSTVPFIMGANGITGPRALDSEPNNDPGTSVLLTPNEFVNGSILVTSATDQLDFYHIQTQPGMQINVSLYHKDYDPANPWHYNLNILMGPIIEDNFMFHDIAGTEYQWESVSHVALASETWFIVVIGNQTPQGDANSLPVNYSLHVDMKPVTSIQRGWTMLGHIGKNTSRSSAWVRVDPEPVYDEVLYFNVIPGSMVDIDMFSYLKWDWADRDLRPLNFSWEGGPGHEHHLIFAGSEGDVYLKLVAQYGEDDLQIQLGGVDWNGYRDYNNAHDEAFEVFETEPLKAYLQGAIDPVDWYSIHMEAGEHLSKVSFQITDGDWDLYRMMLLDPKDNVVALTHNTADGDWPTDTNPVLGTMSINDFEAEFEGVHRVAVLPVMTMRESWQGDYVAPECKYTITFTLPNLPPELIGKLPQIDIKEDATSDDLDLSDHFMDPDGNNLEYSVASNVKHLTVKVNGGTGAVEITPDPDWFGKEMVTFRATDDGPGRKFVNADCLVVVSSLNDAPSIVKGRHIVNITVNESETRDTDIMSTVFTDVDNDAERPLIYKVEVASSDLTPRNAKFPLPLFNATRDVLVVGPVDEMYGNVTLRVIADDANKTDEADLPAIEFNVTVLHQNHPPMLRPGIDGTVNLTLVEDDKEDGWAEYDLWTMFEDLDTDYTDDAIEFSYDGDVNVHLDLSPEGTIRFDATMTEFFPGQKYEETIIVYARDGEDAEAMVNFTVTVIPEDDKPMFRAMVPAAPQVKINEGDSQIFKVTVEDPDTPEALMNYTWTLDGSDLICYSSLYIHTTDFTSADGGSHTVKVKVDSGEWAITREWNVTVDDVNRPPTGAVIESPVNASRFEPGDKVILRAQASDPDGDDLTYTWYLGSKVLGTGNQLSIDDVGDWDEDFHTVTLVVDDGKDEVNTTVTLEVKRPPKEEPAPGFGAPMLLAAVGMTAIIIAIRYRRRWSA